MQRTQLRSNVSPWAKPLNQVMRHIGQVQTDTLRAEVAALGTPNLVLIAGLRPDAREDAIRRLARIATWGDIHSEGFSIRDFVPTGVQIRGDPITIAVNGTQYTWQSIYGTPMEVCRIAREENSVELASYILGIAALKLDPPHYTPLIELLIEKKRWWPIDSAASVFPESVCIELGKHIEELAKTSTRWILPRSGAIHPHAKTRRAAIDAIAGQALSYGNRIYALARTARQSHYDDTGRYAVDTIVRMFMTGSRDVTYGAMGDILRNETRKAVRLYATGKLFKLWDRTEGYVYPHVWDCAAPEAQRALEDYFTKNSKRLETNQEWHALFWLARRGNKRALSFLCEHVSELPHDSIALFMFIAEKTDDSAIRKQAQDAIAREKQRQEKKQGI